jgi:hypothetical protein
MRILGEYEPVMPALGRLRQGDQEFKASLCYIARLSQREDGERKRRERERDREREREREN